jgi:hypothetical protein
MKRICKNCGVQFDYHGANEGSGLYCPDCQYVMSMRRLTSAVIQQAREEVRDARRIKHG